MINLNPVAQVLHPYGTAGTHVFYLLSRFFSWKCTVLIEMSWEERGELPAL